MAKKKTAKVGRSCCKSTVRLSDTQGGLKRIGTLLSALNQRICDDNPVVAWALLDGARHEVASLLKESAA